MKVLGIGEVVLDKTYLLNEYPLEGGKYSPQKVEYSLGGPVPAALILLSKLGEDCSLVASIGDDKEGERVKDRIKKAQVKFFPVHQKETKSHIYIVNGQNASRTGIKSGIKHNQLQKISLQLIKEADLIIFDRHETLAFEFVIKHKRPETKIIIDPSTEVSTKTLKMSQFADYPIFPIESLTKVARHENQRVNLHKLFEIAQKPVVITAGENGCIYYDGKEIIYEPAFLVKPVDVLGAGDIFRGGFAYGVLHNWGIKKTIEFANAVAALQCLKVGNETAIPQKEEIFEFLKIAVKKEISLINVLK